jgi:hypothetical protein
MADLNKFQDKVGIYEPDEPLPELSDPVWYSDLGREVLRSVMARGGACFTSLWAVYVRANSGIQASK